MKEYSKQGIFLFDSGTSAAYSAAPGSPATLFLYCFLSSNAMHRLPQAIGHVTATTAGPTAAMPLLSGLSIESPKSPSPLSSSIHPPSLPPPQNRTMPFWSRHPCFFKRKEKKRNIYSNKTIKKKRQKHNFFCMVRHIFVFFLFSVSLLRSLS